MPSTTHPSTTQSSPNSPVGRRTPRVDGPLKVSGKATYTSDFNFPGQLYGVPVAAAIAHGRIEKLDPSAAEKMPGVRAVLHRGNMGKIFRAVKGPGFQGVMDERRPPLEDDIIRYYGQYVAIVLAETLETAKAAADAVEVTYSENKPNVDGELNADKPEVESERGDAEKAFGEAAVKIDQTYVTPAETHNPIELHSTTAVWDGPDLTLYESSQAINNLRGVLAQMMGVPLENVRVITKFLGSGFGGKALAVDALSAGGGGGAAGGQAGETGSESQDDVPGGGPSPAHTAARSAGCVERGKAGFAATGLCESHVDSR